MVACHGKLGTLFLDKEIVQLFLLGELIAQADAVVIDAETDNHFALVRHEGQSTRCSVALIFGFLYFLDQCHGHFVVVVAYGGCLTPYGLPGLIEVCILHVGYLEAIQQVGFLHAFRRMFVLGQFQSQMTGFYHRPSFVAHLVGGPSVVGQ